MPIIIGIVIIQRMLIALFILACTSFISPLANESAICGAIEDVIAIAKAPMTSVILGTHDDISEDMC